MRWLGLELELDRWIDLGGGEEEEEVFLLM